MEDDEALSEQDQTARNLLEALQVKRLRIQEELNSRMKQQSVREFAEMYMQSFGIATSPITVREFRNLPLRFHRPSRRLIT